MDEQRTQIYLKTVAALLDRPTNQEVMDILAANSSWIDEGFLIVMGQVAENMASVGRNYTASWLLSLRNELAASLGKQATHEELDLYQAFLVEVLEAIQKHPNTQVAYLLLVANQDKLNDRLADVLQAWATHVLPSMEEIAGLYAAQTIVDFSNLMKGFSLGNLEINIELAIIGYQVAATLITRDRFPSQWAIIQNNLGLAYSDRIRGSLGENRELAIHYHTQALQEHTRAHFPFDWARGQSNLGLAYSDRICGTRADNLELAIQCYQQALLENIRSHFPELWARTQNHLGIAYSNRVCGKKAENLELAIYCYKQALLEYTLSGYPEMWAAIHNNLGNAYCDRLSGNKADNLELAIECYQQALQQYTRDRFPYDWAKMQNYLGNTYKRLQYTLDAVKAFQSALSIYTPTTFPLESLVSGRNLGDTAFANGMWAEAIEGFAYAIEAFESSPSWVTSDVRQNPVFQNPSDMYDKMAQSCINGERSGQVFRYEYKERFGSRPIIDLLATLDPNQEIPRQILSLKENEQKSPRGFAPSQKKKVKSQKKK